MPSTKKTAQEHAADLAYVLGTVFELEEDPDHPIRNTLDREGIMCVIDLLHLNIDGYRNLTFKGIN